MIITSTNNEKIKFIKKLVNDKKHLFLDSPKLIEEAIKARFPIKYFIREDGKKEKFEHIFEYVRICEGELITVSQNVFKTLSNTIWSQGVIGIVEKIDRVFASPKNNYLILDEVQDPGNVGTLIRSAMGAGFEDIYLLNCANITNDKVIRSTMGAIFTARLYELSREQFIEKFQSFKHKNIVVADMEGENIFGLKISQHCGVVIGNEGNGVSKDIKKLARTTVSIPMQNQLDSINAAVAGSIIMFQITNNP